MYVRNRNKNKNKKRINRVVSNKSKTSRQKRNSKTFTKTVKKTTDTNFLDFFKNKKLLVSLGIFLILFAVLLFISFYSYLSTWKEDNLIFDKGFNIIFSSKYSVNNITGKLGGWLAFVFMYKWFGVASFLFIPWFFITGLKLIGVKLKRYVFLTTILFSLILYFSLFFSGLFTTVGYGVLRGCIGDELIRMIKLWIGKPGLILFLVFTGLILLSVIIPKLFYNVIEKVKNIKLSSKTAGTEENSSETSNSLIENEDEEENIEDKENKDAIDEEEFKIIDISNDENEDTVDRKEEDDELEDEEEDEEDTDSIEQEEIPFEIVNPLEATNEVAEEDCIDDEEDENIPITSEPYDPKKDLSDFILPMHDLLAEHGSASIIIDKEELEANKKRIETTLQNYGIKIEKIVATIGPSVTLYEIVPAPGIRISKIKNLEDDIAL
jgi:S-DNA-T family DNA segregation ATPase FtsK/SpoIIIE